MADNLALSHPHNQRQVLTIDVLPDDVLLEIFDFYVLKNQDPGLNLPPWHEFGIRRMTESWQSLVHVCQRWRGLVFGSPRRLNLKICYHTPRISARQSLDIWPALPILILGRVSEHLVDDAIAGLEHSDCICQISLEFAPQIENLWTAKLWPAIQVPFPKLADICLSCGSMSYEPVLPDSFLGGSAPRLRFLEFYRISFPGLPKLLLSATHLVHLHLHNIPHSGYISPKAMAICLSRLTSLETLRLETESPRSSPDQKNRRSRPPTRFVLPSLTIFLFEGVNEYLEDLLSRIDAPQVYRLSITLFNDIRDHFDTPELNQFISRTPTFGAYDEARLVFGDRTALVRFQSHPETSHATLVEVKLLCRVSDWQFSSLAQICTFSLVPLLTMENLYIYEHLYSPPYGVNDIKNTEWLNLLRL